MNDNDISITAKELVEQHAYKSLRPLKVELKCINKQHGLWSCDIEYLNHFLSHSGYGLPRNVEEDAFERFVEKVILTDTWSSGNYAHWVLSIDRIRTALLRYRSILFIDGDDYPPDDLFRSDIHSEEVILSKLDSNPLYHPHVLKFLVCGKESPTLQRCISSTKPLHTFLLRSPDKYSSFFIVYLMAQIRLLYPDVSVNIYNSIGRSSLLASIVNEYKKVRV